MVVFCLLLALTLGTFCRAQNDSTSFYIEAEDGYGFSADSVHWRSNAEGNKTVWLRKDENLRFNFCLPASDKITVEEIRYSTDGLEMEGAVLIDDNEVGTFKTANNSNYGLNWDVFNTTAGGFNPVSLDAGRHTLVIALRDYMDDWGIEIDSLKVSTASNSTMEQLACDNPAGTTGVTEPYTETTQSIQK